MRYPIYRMSRKRRLVRFAIHSLADSFIIIGAYTLAFSARALMTPLDYISSMGFILAATIITITALYFSGVYRRIWSQTSGHGIILLIQASLSASAVVLILDILIQPRPLPISVYILANVMVFGGLVVIRYRSRLIGAFEWRWRAVLFGEFPDDDRERVIIIGAGESGQTTALRLKHRMETDHYKIVGFVDDNPEKIGMYVETCPVLGTTNDIPRIVDEYHIDLLIMAIHNIAGKDMRRILELAEATPARVKVVPDMLKLFDSKVTKSFLRDVQPEDLIGRSVISKHASVDLQRVSNKVVMITGAAGSIGSELSKQMLDYNPRVIILLDNNESALHDLHLELAGLHPTLRIIPFLVDVAQYDQLRAAFTQYRPQVIFHAAAYKHVPMLEHYPNEAVRVNVGGTYNLAELAALNDVERFVLISTDKAVNPSSVMGASKRICELIIHAFAERDNHNTLFTTVRFGNVLGSRGSVVPIFNRQLDVGGPLTVTDQGMTRYFMSTSEAVNLVIHAAAMTEGDDIFVLKMGEVVRIVDLAERMIRLRGLRPYTDIQIEFTGVRPGEKMHEELFDKGYEQPGETGHPHIFKLDSWRLNGHAPQLLEQIQTLVNVGIQDDNRALDELRAICDMTDENLHTHS